VKLSVSSKLRSVLNILGVTGFSLREAFPTVLDEQYRVVWKKFIKTTAAKELAKNKHYGKVRVCSAFVSYISSMDDKCWRDVSVNIQELNMLNVTSYYARIRDLLHRKGFSSLRKIRQTNEVEFHDNDFIRGVTGIKYTGYVILTPNGRQTLQQFLETLVPSTFRSFPVEFMKSPKLDTVLASKQNWYQFYTDKNINVEIARASMNMLVVRYDIRPDAIAFYGNKSTSAAYTYLNKFVESI